MSALDNSQRLLKEHPSILPNLPPIKMLSTCIFLCVSISGCIKPYELDASPTDATIVFKSVQGYSINAFFYGEPSQCRNRAMMVRIDDKPTDGQHNVRIPSGRKIAIGFSVHSDALSRYSCAYTLKFTAKPKSTYTLSPHLDIEQQSCRTSFYENGDVNNAVDFELSDHFMRGNTEAGPWCDDRDFTQITDKTNFDTHIYVLGIKQILIENYDPKRLEKKPED